MSWWSYTEPDSTRSEEGYNSAVDYKNGCLRYRVAMSGALVIVISLFGLLGNSLTSVVFWKDRKSSATAFLLVVLATIDSLVLLTWGSMKAAHAIASYLRDNASLFMWPYLLHYGFSVSFSVQLMSTWCIVVVTFVRYIAVCQPERSHRWLAPNVVRKATAIVLCSCALFNVPHVFDSYIVYNNATRQMQTLRSQWAKSQLYYYIYLSVLYNLVLYVAPLSTIIFCTWKIVRSLAAARKRRQEMSNADRDEQEITFSLMIVVVLFVFCQLTLPVHRIWVSVTTKSQRDCPNASYYYNSLVTLSAVFNSSINFVVFVLCCKGFKSRVKIIVTMVSKALPWSATNSVAPDEDTVPNDGDGTRVSYVTSLRVNPSIATQP